MRLSRPRPALALLAATAMLAVAACGGSNNSSSTSGSSGKKTGSSGNTGTQGGTGSTANGGAANVAISQGQKKGGTLNIVSAEGWEHLDPGQSYFQIDYLVVYATQRPLYSFTPNSKMTPDLAAGPPQISSDGKTVKVKIKPGLHFGGATTREITSADVKYAFERDFNPNVPNGYAGSYYPIVGADKSKGGPISGITTPDKDTIVFKLTSNYGATFAQALTLPGSAPVPKEIAGPMDKHSPTLYDSDVTKQGFEGPYMATQYQPDHVRQQGHRAGLQRPVHDQGLRAGPQPDAGAQPELEGRHGLPSGVRGPDRVDGRRRPERARAPDARQPGSADGGRAARARAQDRLRAESRSAVDLDAGPVLRVAEHDPPAV
jgi:ABC-type transport system substrate-binding protein